MGEFLKVDFATPMLFLVVAVILFVIGVPVLIHGLVRRKKFATLRDGEQTYARRASIRTELLTSALAALLVVVCLGAGFSGYARALDHLQANIEQEFSPTKLEIHHWTGSSAVATLTLPDGTTFDPATIAVEDDYRPVINEAPRNDRLAANPEPTS